MTAKSWGRWPAHRAAREITIVDRSRALPAAGSRGMLAHGLGRSYGDVGLNEDGTLLMTRGLDRFIAFDRRLGVLRAEAGVSLDEILQLAVPVGWFVPVSPGTRFVTLGGAVANDVHGKNHYRAGSFGCHVRAFELLRSDGTRFVCTPSEHVEWFAATIGGLGLTGFMTWIEIQLTPIASPNLWVVNRRFRDLSHYWDVDAELGTRHAYSVAWVDCLGRGRGIYSAADFSGSLAEPRPHRARRRRMPIDPPFSLINGFSLRALNTAYYHRPIAAEGLQHLQSFFYPLDAIHDWNRVYGRRGFHQYQCVLPRDAMRTAAGELFDSIGRSDQGSILAVLKIFGARPSPGMLSFPRPGATLALDFPHRGERTLKLFRELDAIVAGAGGALYPAKDGRMPAALFRSSFPKFEAFTRFVDPAFSSSLWRRVAPDLRP